MAAHRRAEIVGAEFGRGKSRPQRTREALRNMRQNYAPEHSPSDRSELVSESISAAFRTPTLVSRGPENLAFPSRVANNGYAAITNALSVPIMFPMIVIRAIHISGIVPVHNSQRLIQLERDHRAGRDAYLSAAGLNTLAVRTSDRSRDSAEDASALVPNLALRVDCGPVVSRA